MSRYVALLALVLFACNTHSPTIVDAGVIGGAHVVLAAPDAGHRIILAASQPGNVHRTDNFLDNDAGVIFNVTDNATTGQADISGSIAPGAFAGAIPDSGVVAGSYGDSTHVGAFTVNAKGDLTSASNVSIAFPSSAVTSVTGSSGVNCSPTTGSVNCTNTGVTSVSGATGAVSNSVANGLTGDTSFTSGCVVLGNGPSPLNCVASISLSNLPHGTADQILFTNHAGTAAVYESPSLDVQSTGSGALEVVGLQGLLMSTAGGQYVAGNVLTFVGGSPAIQYKTPQPPGSSNFNVGSASLSVGPTNTVIASASLTVPNGANVLISASFNFRNNLDFVSRGGSGEDVVYGVGDNGTGGNFYGGASTTVSVPPDSTADVIGGFAGHQSGHAPANMVWRTTGTGSSVTYQAMANASFYSGMTGQAWIFVQQVP